MNFKHIITQNSDFVNSFTESEKNEIIDRLDECQVKINNNFDRILTTGQDLLKIKNKEKLLLEFRRFIEMLVRTELILCVENIYDKKITVISPENILFYLDKKYYSSFKILTFTDIFKIETNGYNKIHWLSDEFPPHIGLILSYIEKNYNSTYRFFKNRNMEYHCIYTMLYQLNQDIKELITILNSYHYLTDEESLKMYEMDFSEIRKKVKYVIFEIKKMSVLF